MSFPDYQRHFENAAKDIIKARHLEQHSQAIGLSMGTLNEHQVSGIVALALGRIMKQGTEGDTARGHSMRNVLHQVLMDYIADLNRDIARFQAEFEKRFGDAWREEIALRVFGSDEVPEQREGESVEDYRQRLEQELVAKMLNPDGTIKGKCLNDPELRKYAEWAQKVRNRDIAIGIANDLSDPAITPEQTRDILERIEQAKNSELNNYAMDALEGQGAQKKIAAQEDSHTDEISSKALSASDGSAFNSSGPGK